jgi:hypothetical protein
MSVVERDSDPGPTTVDRHALHSARMTTQLTRPRATGRTGSAIYVLPGLAALVIAIYMVGWQPEYQEYASVQDRVTDGIFVAYLVTGVLGALAAARDGLAPRVVAYLIGGGYTLVLSAVVTMNILEREPSWFMFLAGPGQLAAMAGFVTWAVWGRRHDVLTRAAAALCAVGGLTAIIGSRAGLSVLIAGFWFMLAARRPR